MVRPPPSFAARVAWAALLLSNVDCYTGRADDAFDSMLASSTSSDSNDSYGSQASDTDAEGSDGNEDHGALVIPRPRTLRMPAEK